MPEYFIFATSSRFDSQLDGPVNIQAPNPRAAALRYAKQNDTSGDIYVCEDLTVVRVSRRVSYGAEVNPGGAPLEEEVD